MSKSAFAQEFPSAMDWELSNYQYCDVLYVSAAFSACKTAQSVSPVASVLSTTTMLQFLVTALCLNPTCFWYSLLEITKET